MKLFLQLLRSCRITAIVKITIHYHKINKQTQQNINIIGTNILCTEHNIQIILI